MTFAKRRDRFTGMSQGIGRVFGRLGLSPNQWTLVSIIPALTAAWMLIREEFLLAAGFFILAGFLDMVDGSVARVKGTVTKLGGYLDTVVDRYVEGIVLFGLLFASLPAFILPAHGWVFLTLFGGMMTTYSKAAAREKGVLEGGEMRGGLLERAERLLILFAGLLLGAVEPLYLTWALALLAMLTNLTAVQRVFMVKGIARSTKGYLNKKGE